MDINKDINNDTKTPNQILMVNKCIYLLIYHIELSNYVVAIELHTVNPDDLSFLALYAIGGKLTYIVTRAENSRYRMSLHCRTTLVSLSMNLLADVL